MVLVLVQFVMAKATKTTKTHLTGILMESTSFLIMLLITARFRLDLIFVKGHSGSLRRAVQDFPTFTEHLHASIPEGGLATVPLPRAREEEQDMAELALKMVALTEQKEGNGTTPGTERDGAFGR